MSVLDQLAEAVLSLFDGPANKSMPPGAAHDRWLADEQPGVPAVLTAMAANAYLQSVVTDPDGEPGYDPRWDALCSHGRAAQVWGEGLAHWPDRPYHWRDVASLFCWSPSKYGDNLGIWVTQTSGLEIIAAFVLPLVYRRMEELAAERDLDLVALNGQREELFEAMRRAAEDGEHM